MAYGETDTGGATRIGQICSRYNARPDALVEILIDVQAEFGCVSDAHAAQIAGRLNLSRAEVHGARSFYSDLSAEPKGRRCVKLCQAEACQAVGSDALKAAAEAALEVKLGGTGMPGEIWLEPVYCLGNCALAPAAMVDERLIGRASVDAIMAALEGGEHD
ncbi:NAD(P)H-dependent oxidoreductase subunit E [Hyphobacterium sp. HN65]|uniref:NAD(P)H-dependent oxidoreductase subunit E n=1 Tax=Hyphobacterium lacteum TaxID=3116575 RepID=A0ABU7LSC5_9PROT|nr:NAD(P)H-dependent oxidoreductase subunit E [Hyphobacterium sp. HN65]MEE2526804.1 NAD(P)H-dependent oxidoreductase subunit E [Hyphobacterium sp. HN65]